MEDEDDEDSNGTNCSNLSNLKLTFVGKPRTGIRTTIPMRKTRGAMEVMEVVSFCALAGSWSSTH